jgi:hypothetical protein
MLNLNKEQKDTVKGVLLLVVVGIVGIIIVETMFWAKGIHEYNLPNDTEEYCNNVMGESYWQHIKFNDSCETKYVFMIHDKVVCGVGLKSTWRCTQ